LAESVNQDSAIDIARDWLTKNGFDLEGRTARCTKQGDRFVVAFSVPPDTLGGDLTLTLDAATGEIVDKRFER